MPARKKSKFEPVTDFAATFMEWLGIKAQATMVSKRQKELHDRMCAQMEIDGYQDEKGSYYVDFEEDEVDGYVGLQYRCQEKPLLDEERAEELLTEKGLLEKCVVMVPELDQAAIYAAHQEGLISQEELDEIFVKNITYAFWPRKTPGS